MTKANCNTSYDTLSEANDGYRIELDHISTLPSKAQNRRTCEIMSMITKITVATNAQLLKRKLITRNG